MMFVLQLEALPEEDWLAPQCLQKVEPEEGVYVFSGQAVHEVEPLVAAYFPEGHAGQLVVRPVSEEAVPHAHSSQ